MSKNLNEEAQAIVASNLTAVVMAFKYPQGSESQLKLSNGKTPEMETVFIYREILQAVKQIPEDR